MRHAIVGLVLLFGCGGRSTKPEVKEGTKEGAEGIEASGPQVEVTDWAQVERFNCAVDDAGAPLACQGDGDCPQGQLCDNSEGCGCCVAAPPEIEPGAELARALFTDCHEGACAPPPYCTPTGEGVCSMTFDGTIWVWATSPLDATEPLAEVRRDLCILVESTQRCMWRLDLPMGEYELDHPLPFHYSGSYECGGRTCNGAAALRVAPLGEFQVRLVEDGCR